MLIAQTQSYSSKVYQADIFSSILQILGASFLLAICAQISFPLYFTPVRLSFQTLAVMLIGLTMGSRKGLLSVCVYLAEGLFGLPVFAGGNLGIMTVLGPSGGYFLGFLFQVYLVGVFSERQAAFRGTQAMSILLLSCAVQLGFGVIWLAQLVGFEAALVMGFFPFIFGELLKVIGLTVYLRSRL